MILHNQTKLTRPFLKWAGNKYNCLKTILKYFPKANRYIEPFAGSGAVFLNTAYSYSILGEENLDLISLYQHLQKGGASFIALCESYFLKENNNSERYYQLRDLFNSSTDSLERAALFLYLNRHGFNGLCRYNFDGKYNVPFGSHEKPYFPKERMLFFHLKARDAEFNHNDFQQTFLQAEKGDLIYCDPPYVPIEQSSNFTAYTQKKFGEPEQIKLVELANEATKKGVTVIISNHDTPFTRLHYKNGQLISFKVPRCISRNAEQRKPVQELLAIFKP